MARTKINNQASVIIISDARGNILLGGYDQGYPREEFRGFLNPMGGNYSREDRSPLAILRREISEELDPAAIVKEGAFAAPSEDVEMIRNAVLGNAEPVADYLQTHYSGDKTAIVSVFSSVIDDTSMDVARANLLAGKRIVTEGIAGITSPDRLVKGIDRLAWGAPHYVGTHLGITIPPTNDSRLALLGKVRPTIEAYKEEFDYSEIRLI